MFDRLHDTKDNRLIVDNVFTSIINKHVTSNMKQDTGYTKQKLKQPFTVNNNT